MLASRYLLRNTIGNLIKSSGCQRNYQPGTKAYEGDGKTSATVLNSEDGAGLMIDSFSQTGFRLNNGMLVVGPMAIFARFYFLT
jgi:NADH dehydrogenase [ubiquinone] 1 alpha subcomplex assembly factor 3